MVHDSSSYIFLGIYILFWIIVCYKYYKEVNFTAGLVVMVSYLLYGILAFFLYSDNFLGASYGNLSLFPFIYLFTMLYMFLTPVFKYEKANILRVKRPSNSTIQLFLVVYSVCACVMLPSIIGSLQEGLKLLMLDVDGGAELYQLTSDNYVKRSSGISGVRGLFSIFYNIFSDVAKFIFFYYLTINNKKKVYVYLFSFVLIVDLLYPLSKGARTDVIMSLFSILMAIMLLYPFYNKRLRIVLRGISVIVVAIVAIPFMTLTISRFGESSAGTSGGMLSYSGQAVLNFNIYALDAGGTRHGDRTINLFKQFVFDDIPEDIDEVRAKYAHLKMDDSVFSTYVGDFVLDFGPVGAFFIFVFLSILYNTKVRIKNKTISFRTLFLIYFILSIAMHGGMYLFYYSFMENLTVMAFCVTYIVFKIDSNNSDVVQYLIRDISEC